MGLGIGWRLAAAGLVVDLFEAAQAGGGASHAAAGMLAAGAEAEPGEEALLALNQASLALWPAFRDELEALSGMSIGYRAEGTLLLAMTRDDVLRLRHEAAFQGAQGVRAEWLSGREVRRLEPHLAPEVAGAAFHALDHQVDNRLLAAALLRAFQAVGGRLHEHAPVRALLTRQGRAGGVVLDDGEHPAEAVLLCAGAWSSGIAGLPKLPPLRPVKGQLVALDMGERPIVRHTLWAPRVYMVPRTSGRLVIGATVEEAGFDARMTAGGLLSLLEPAWRAVPAIEELPVLETWAGFRPGSPDDAPLLGLTGLEGLFIAAGHHRNGILLTPVTAAAMSELILDGSLPPAIAPFHIGRFEKEQAA